MAPSPPLALKTCSISGKATVIFGVYVLIFIPVVAFNSSGGTCFGSHFSYNFNFTIRICGKAIDTNNNRDAEFDLQLHHELLNNVLKSENTAICILRHCECDVACSYSLPQQGPSFLPRTLSQAKIFHTKFKYVNTIAG